MELLVWAGAVLSLLGIGALVWCILQAVKARRERLEGEAMKARLQRVVVVNMAALFVSAIGLMMVVLGVFLA
ncbi:hypothetical protein ACMU_09755 [Actibacterium mucosum KCTC 23349]|uniref:Uncharacterized protein n=1 Tax=Actibacterium mucosum KCTC 23349 TaxID=1454373 RepID=A0A037ZKG0_9RHOB|nr:hypothetical protein [Actibacterium mucosum]KAJ56037.1 hypothetical protein ACMU_09755 [Actibacterium mucosum KCTC 23349]